MKKVTMFLLSMFLLMTISFAQETESQTISGEISGELILPTGVATSVDSIDVTFTTVYNDVKEALSGLADGLQVGGEYVYEILVQQQLIVGITWLITVFIFILTTYLFFYFIRRIAGDEGSEDFNIGAVMTIGGVFLLTLLISFVDMVRGLTGFFNPEYGAIQEILKLIN